MEQTSGTICGVCGRYIEYPTMWGGTLPERCNGIHQTMSNNDTHWEIVIRLLEEIKALLTK